MATVLTLVLVFLSGISALLFETLWLRLSGLVFGNSVWSAALILSSFMAGLALGNALAAGSRRPRPRPLSFYAMLELAIAVFGCAIVIALPRAGTWLRPIYQALWGHQEILIALRLLLCFLVLLVPSTAMGLTLPVLIGDPSLRLRRFGRVLGLLYGCNTLGAVVGAIAGEAYLVRAFGVQGTALFAGSVNCLAAVLAWLLSGIASASGREGENLLPAKLRQADTAADHKHKQNGLTPSRTDYFPLWRLILVSFASGAFFLCLEVVWFRFLRLYLASSPTAFSLMLAIVLAGIGLGSIAGSLVGRFSRYPSKCAPPIALWIAVFILVSYLSFPVLRPQAAEPFYLDQWSEIVPLSFVLMFPTSFLSGILFPVLASWTQFRIDDRTTSVGIITSGNTIGAAVGPLIGSFLLLPSVGFQTTLIVCALGYALLGLVLSTQNTWSIRRPAGAVMWTGCVVICVLIATFPYHRDEEHFAQSRSFYETGTPTRLVRKVEGTSETYQLLGTELLDQPYFYQLLTNSFSMSSTNPHGQHYMRLFAYLPLSLQPEAKDALLICYGCGVTADALTRDAQLQRIDIVDISREVLSLAPYYSGANYSNPLLDSRVKAVVQDGRFFLQASERQYDVITGEPPPPKVMGSVNLYTEEFFRLMRDRLKEGGIASFWLPIYQLRIEETKAILRAFHNAFPNASVWSGPDNEWIMLGMKGPVRQLSKAQTERLWNEPATAADLRRIGLEVPQQLPALFLMDAAEIDRLVGNVPPLTDQFPKRLTDAHTDAATTASLAERYVRSASAAQHFFSSPMFTQIWPRSRAAIEPLFLIRETQYMSKQGQTNVLAELDFYLRRTRLRVPVLEVLGSNEFRIAIARAVSQHAEMSPAQALPELIADALGRRDIGDAIRWLEIKRGGASHGGNDLFLLIYLYCLNGESTKAEALAGTVSIQKDESVKWLWGKLHAEFGFSPPR